MLCTVACMFLCDSLFWLTINVGCWKTWVCFWKVSRRFAANNLLSPWSNTSWWEGSLGLFSGTELGSQWAKQWCEIKRRNNRVEVTHFYVELAVDLRATQRLSEKTPTNFSRTGVNPSSLDGDCLLFRRRPQVKAYGWELGRHHSCSAQGLPHHYHDCCTPSNQSQSFIVTSIFSKEPFNLNT